MSTPARCGKEVNTLPVLTGCPADTEYFMVAGATGGFGVGGYGLRSWAILKACICLDINAEGIFIVNGVDMTNGLPDPDTAPGNKYINTDYAGVELVVFYNGINRYLLPDVEYELLAEGGFQTTAAMPPEYTAEDNFVVFPNNTCEVEEA